MFKFKTIKYLRNSLQNTVFHEYSTFQPKIISHIIKNSKPGDIIQVQGWVKSLRNQKDNIFLDLSDGSTCKRLQILLPKTLKPESLNTGASIIATGKLSLSPKGQLELAADNIEVSGDCIISDGYPFAPRKQYEPEYIRQHLHFRPRTNKFGALLRLRNAATLAFHNYLNSRHFVNIHAPILTSNDCEGAGEVFKVMPDSEVVLRAMHRPGLGQDEVYFNKKVFLSVSAQLHLEAAAHALSKVYTFGPTFRAENSKSRFHLSEFYMLEAEVAFLSELGDLISIVEDLVKNVCAEILDKSVGDFQMCRESEEVVSWLDKEFPVLSYSEVGEILDSNRDKYAEKFKKSEGLCKEHEIFLVKHCGNVPVFVVDWPEQMKPFYMKCREGKALALDLLAPNVGEVVGGSLRENNFDVLKRKMPEHLEWYLDLRKFGGVATGGFGLGFERFIQSILGIANIKDVMPFPRWPHNCSL